MDNCIENVIESIKDEKRLSESHPDECEIVAENLDGSLCAIFRLIGFKLIRERICQKNKKNDWQNMQEMFFTQVITRIERANFDLNRFEV